MHIGPSTVPCRSKQVLCLVLTLWVLLLSSTVNADKVGAWIGKSGGNSNSKSGSNSNNNITADDVETENSFWISALGTVLAHSAQHHNNINSGGIHYMVGGSSRNRHRITVESQQSSVRDAGRRIVGGHPATGTYRWVAKLEKLGGQWTGCVGNLISERWIVTAAHCILNGQNTGYKSAATPGNSKIKYGCLNTDSASCKTVDAVRYVAHPCYTPSDDQDHDDIALIELRAPVEGMAGQFARVNGLNGSISIGDGEDVILAGFGATQPNGGNEAIDLMQVTVPKRPTSICQQQNPSAVRNQYVNYDNVICTGGSSGKDSCNGDSGGPAIVMRDGTPWLVGVLSVGSELPDNDQNCGAQGRVAVYTSVEKYSNWIYAVINNMYFCCRECPVIATRKPPYLSCPGPPLAPATSCLDGEGAKSSPATGPTGTSPPLPPPRVPPRGRVSLPLLSPHTSLPLLLFTHLPFSCPSLQFLARP